PAAGALGFAPPNVCRWGRGSPRSPAMSPEQVFHLHAARAYNLGRRLLNDEAAAEAVALEALLRAGQRPEAPGGDAWVVRATVQAVLGVRRRWGPRRRARESPRPVEEAVARLPEAYRDVLVLADVEGLANAEVGALLGLSLPAVKSRLHRARLQLCEALARHTGGTG